MHAFGQPRGLLGKLGGKLMARMNRDMAVKGIELLDVQPSDKVLEIGFGPGAGIELLSQVITSGWVTGVDPSEEMCRQAKSLNAKAIQSGKVELLQCSVEQMPLDTDTFDKAMSINSMPFWPDPVPGLREIRRTLKPGGSIVLGFSYHSGQKKEKIPDILEKAGFTNTTIARGEGNFFVCSRNL